MPPTPNRYVFQCECGHMLTITQGKTVTCPVCQCTHRWADLLPRADYPEPHAPQGGGNE